MTNFLRRLYKELILKEATANSPLDPNSEEALYEFDESGPKNEFVRVENFNWQRSKSNLCVKYNGFSFYYARYAYSDPDFTYIGLGHLPNRNKAVGCIHFEHDQPDMLLIIDEISINGEIRIISASKTDEFSSAGKIYERRKKAKQKRNESVDITKPLILKNRKHSF